MRVVLGWSTVGALAVLGLISLGFLALIPAAALGAAIGAGAHPPDRTAFGMAAGGGLLFLLVAHSNRNGPLNPDGWGTIGALLLAFGLVGFAVARHRAGGSHHAA